MYELELTRGLVAFIDDSDVLEIVGMGKWQALKGFSTWYARTDICDATYLLHRVIMKCYSTDRNEMVDHIDGNGLNCVRSNLRVVTRSENTFNSVGPRSDNKSGVRGVHWNSQKQKWTVEIQFNGERHYLGSFHSFNDAVSARKLKENELCPSLLRR